MTLKALYFDDDSSEREKLSQLLTSTGLMRVEPHDPPVNLNLDPFRDGGWDVILVDYDLTKRLDSGDKANFKGGTLATHLHEQLVDCPVMLLTRKNLLGPSEIQVLEVVRMFDGVVYKGELLETPDSVVQQIATVCQGFALLRNAQRDSWAGLRDVIGTRSQLEEGLLKEAGPPLHKHENWHVLEMARWIKDVVVEYPGILYDALHAATLLGISLEAFNDKQVQQTVESARYSGPFTPLEGRWWKNRLREVAQELMLIHDKSGSVLESFALAFGEAYGVALPTSSCVDSGKPRPERVCCVLHQPVRAEFSLAYYPDKRPAVMDKAYVSFRAIRYSNDVNDELFDADDRPTLERVRAGEK